MIDSTGSFDWVRRRGGGVVGVYSGVVRESVFETDEWGRWGDDVRVSDA